MTSLLIFALWYVFSYILGIFLLWVVLKGLDMGIHREYYRKRKRERRKMNADTEGRSMRQRSYTIEMPSFTIKPKKR